MLRTIKRFAVAVVMARSKVGKDEGKLLKDMRKTHNGLWMLIKRCFEEKEWWFKKNRSWVEKDGC
jgi:hypothetical protein